MIPLCVPEIDGNEWAYIKECLDTGWVSSVGSYVDRFEQEVAARTGNRRGVATASGTAALHVALQVAGVRADDEVLISTLTFIAPANAVRYVGAWPVFVDAEPDFWQLDPQKLADFLANNTHRRDGELWNRDTGRRIKAVVPVHILGHPCDMRPIVEMAREYGLAIIEDATEALGALYDGEPVGHCGDMACFSFNGNKIITTGGGGMIVTDDEALAARAKYLTTQAKDDPVEYIHGEVGYNYRLTNIQAAMGCAQLEKLGDRVERKRTIAATYREALAAVPGVAPAPEAPWARSSFWLYTILVDRTAGSREILCALERMGVQTRPLWQPLHLSPPYRTMPATDCKVAEDLYRRGLSLPCSVGLGRDQDRVLQALLDLLVSGTRA